MLLFFSTILIFVDFDLLTFFDDGTSFFFCFTGLFSFEFFFIIVEAVRYPLHHMTLSSLFRKKQTEELTDNIPDETDHEDDILTNVALGSAIKKLSDEDRELIILRYVNEVPVSVLSKLYGISRFAMSRRIRKILSFLKKEFSGEEGYHEKAVKESHSGII